MFLALLWSLLLLLLFLLCICNCCLDMSNASHLYWDRIIAVVIKFRVIFIFILVTILIDVICIIAIMIQSWWLT